MFKKKVFQIVDIFFIVVFSLLIVFSIYKIVNWKLNNNRNHKINSELREYIIVGGNDKYNIDFPSLKEKNPDTIAYLMVPGTRIDYVIVRGENNDYYLNHNFNKENNQSGWIFADYKNQFDGTDKNIVIYGHNTLDKSMFGSLKDTLSKEWYLNKNNHKIILVTENGLEKYEVFSIYKIDNEDYYITTNFNDSASYKKFLSKIKSRSIHNFDVTLEESDQILTLSTCANNGSKRVVLHAKKINE